MYAIISIKKKNVKEQSALLEQITTQLKALKEIKKLIYLFLLKGLLIPNMLNVTSIHILEYFSQWKLSNNLVKSELFYGFSLNFYKFPYSNLPINFASSVILALYLLLSLSEELQIYQMKTAGHAEDVYISTFTLTSLF